VWAAPLERLPLASRAETRAQQREPEQQAVAQWEERPAWQQLGSRASAQQRLAYRRPEHLASASQRAYPPQEPPQELQRPEPLQQQPA
jgi:hypothetical protein